MNKSSTVSKTTDQKQSIPLPRLKPGRLFWKVFLAFWAVLLLANIIVGLAVWLHRPTWNNSPLIAGGPGATLMVRTAVATLETGGTEGLITLSIALHKDETTLQLHAIDKNGHDLFDLPADQQARKQAAEIAASDNPRRFARYATTATGQRYLIYLSHNQSKSNLPGVDGVDGFNKPAALVNGSSNEGPPDRAMGPREHGPISPPLLLIITGLITSLGFSALLAWYLAKPITVLRQAFHALASGRLETRIQPLIGKRRDELADLGHDFDRMSQQLQGLMNTQQRLLHDVSHELRSPLARLQAAISLARQDPNKMLQTLERIELEAHRLDQLVGELLTLSRLENDNSPAARQPIDLVELIAGIADDAHFEAAPLGKHVDFSSSGELIAWVSGELLFRACENVIRNAVKHTTQGTTVEIGIMPDPLNHCARISVADRGPGVADNQLALIFEPFYRGEHGWQTKGFGLGLAIAKRAILAHGGEISARNRDGGGLLIDITLPLGKAEDEPHSKIGES